MIIKKLSINFFIITTLILFLFPLFSCENIKKQISKDSIYLKDNKKEQNYFNYKNFAPPSDVQNLEKEIQAARDKKDQAEIKCQEKKIYVISLGVLSGIFLLILIIYSIFKCYLFCLSRNEKNSALGRIRISKLGKFYLEESFDLNKNKENEKNNDDNLGNSKNMDKNDAPTCFSVNKNNNNNTFNPDNYDENNNYYKPYKIEDN